MQSCVSRRPFAVSLAATGVAALSLSAVLWPARALAVTESDLPPAEDLPPRQKYTPIISGGGNSGNGGAGLKSSASKGPYALIEWNPADLMWERIHVSGEYVIVDGFAFGGMAEYQKQSDDKYTHATSAAGVTATQYIESQTLKGTFLRGEMAAMGSIFTRKDVDVQQEQAVYGLSLGADAGYRFLLTQRITGSASYGARRTVPDFFAATGDTPVEDWKTHNKHWTMRVQLALGVTL